MSTHQIQYTDQQYKDAAIRWLPEFLLMPVLECKSTLQYMTGMPGITGKVKLPAAESNAQLAPYKSNRSSAASTDLVFRQLETFEGNVSEEFDPQTVATLLIGRNTPSLGDGVKNVPSTKLVLGSVMKSIGKHLHDSLFTAKRNANGDTTADLFDGWATIAEAEMAAGNISKAKGNLFELDEAITSVNAVDIAKEIERSCDPVLRRTDKFLFCAPEFYDAYCDAYLLTHNGVNYNKQYEQPVLEGSNRKTTIVALDCLAGVKEMFVTPKLNMLYGYDNLSNASRIEVNRFSSWMLTLAAAMWFGTQFYSIDRRMLNVVKLYEKPAATNPGTSDTGMDPSDKG